MAEDFNEATRVQMPALVHLTRLGYKYLRKTGKLEHDPETNILLDVFREQFAKLNPRVAYTPEKALEDIKQRLGYNDLGRSFYKTLTSASSWKLLDFENPQNNVFHCKGEFTCQKRQGSRREGFRPDITLFVNGLPLAFVEVKKPNNPGDKNSKGIMVEKDRMDDRFDEEEYRRFINITQLMIFSNNMEYDDADGIKPISGAFYCTAAQKGEAIFNRFREEEIDKVKNYISETIDRVAENEIKEDFGYNKDYEKEYQTALNPDKPTNRILTSMCSPERLLFLLKYGIAYVHSYKNGPNGTIREKYQKHIMRYQQLFAALAVRQKLYAGAKSGIIWHTQGSGKTALSFYLTRVLKDFYSKQKVVPKFYFIVDRLELLKQAKDEFEARGLSVKTVAERDELMEQFKTKRVKETGGRNTNEIVVVNIQKFKRSTKVNLPSPYDIKLQRVFIIDEAHRSYKPKGCFLANLFSADPDSIKIALTGTPLLKKDSASRKVFGDYIHTYYYDKSVRDGYTLKIKREDIETRYREELSSIYKEKRIEALQQKRNIKKTDITEHDTYVKKLLEYIIEDLKQFRLDHDDNTLGGMIACETSKQAKKIFKFFDEVQLKLNNSSPSNESNLKTGLILHDSGDKFTREQIVVEQFKNNMTVDILIVFQMLLTGFDAPRLKRLYLGRKLKDHGLLQAITRVNRPYNGMTHGYLIDFADIKKNFDDTNKAYLQELGKFNVDPGKPGNGSDLSQIMVDVETLLQEADRAIQILSGYTKDNVEDFSEEISNIENVEELRELNKALVTMYECYNVASCSRENTPLKEKVGHLDISKLGKMKTEVQNRIKYIIKDLTDGDDREKEINEAMRNITFSFKSLGKTDLEIISGGAEMREKLGLVSRLLADAERIDKKDPEYSALQKDFDEKKSRGDGFTPKNIEEYYQHLDYLNNLIKKLERLGRRNAALLSKYSGDSKFVRVHKRILEENAIRKSDGLKSLILEDDNDKIIRALIPIKTIIDRRVNDNDDILKNSGVFKRFLLSRISGSTIPPDDWSFIHEIISIQYLKQ